MSVATASDSRKRRVSSRLSVKGFIGMFQTNNQEVVQQQQDDNNSNASCSEASLEDHSHSSLAISPGSVDASAPADSQPSADPPPTQKSRPSLMRSGSSMAARIKQMENMLTRPILPAPVGVKLSSSEAIATDRLASTCPNPSSTSNLPETEPLQKLSSTLSQVEAHFGRPKKPSRSCCGHIPSHLKEDSTDARRPYDSRECSHSQHDSREELPSPLPVKDDDLSLILSATSNIPLESTRGPHVSTMIEELEAMGRTRTGSAPEKPRRPGYGKQLSSEAEGACNKKPQTEANEAAAPVALPSPGAPARHLHALPVS